jgi:hypothetical protein
MSAASGRMFAVRIHCPSLTAPPRPEITSGVASGTAVWSTRIMLLDSVIAASVTRALACRVVLAEASTAPP